MSPRKIKIVLSQLAENDLADIAAWTAENYGQKQAEIYVDALLDTIDELSSGEPIRSKARDEIAIGLRTFHMSKRGRRGRHLLVYKAADDILTIVRILHDSMEVPRHLPDHDD
ncbi:MAG: type II toxin-antitoxin system RelE/ParE family toxin [Alphaproteobacteria bacterium]|nr:type II toxin-antitoxin system RelE/ParE family toxin [Alphaproteobacteria bacterium]TAD91931.1 MAG: type II toxin-antitoxin system RelE/ParE family toxin [Alphaproteobacteria bacterium]